MGGEAAGKEFEFTDDDAAGIKTFGEPERKAIIPEVVPERSVTAMEQLGGKSVAMNVLDRGQALQQIKTQYATAVRVQVPRDLGRIRESVLKEAELAGSSFYYGWDVKGKGGKSRVEGPSIDMAMSLVRNYGNCVLNNDVTQDETHFTFNAALVDLESGTTITRLFRQRRSQSLGGKMDADRAEDIVFQIGQSKADRNVVVRAMPGWLIEQAIEAAKAGEVKRIDVKTLPETRQRAAKFFASHGVTVLRIEAVLGKTIDKWMADDIVELSGMMTALKEGRATVDEMFPDALGEQKTSTTQEKKDPPKKQEAPEAPKGSTSESAPTSEGKSEAPPVKQEPKTEKTKGKKKAEKEAEPPAQEEKKEAPPVTQPPVAKTATTESLPPFDPKTIRVGIVKCPPGGTRGGKPTHSKWCLESCSIAKDCITLRQGPQAAV